MVFTAADGTTFEKRADWKKYQFALLYSFKNKDGEELAKAPGDIDGQPFDLGNLKNCTVVLPDFADQIQADELEGCKVFIGACGESVFVRNCTNCTFYMCCKQLRTRDCHNCTFYLYSFTEPIIEMSDNMKFACFNGGYEGQAAHMESAGLDPKINKWALVFDFNDEAKTGKNWSLLKPAEVNTTPWFPLGECEVTVPVTGLDEAKAAQAAVAHLSNNAAPGAMQSFSFNTTQEEAEAAMAANDAEPPAPPAPTVPAPAAVSRSITQTMDLPAGGAPAAPAAPAEPPAAAEPTEKIAVGTKVEALYKGGGVWYLAKVAAIHEDGTMDLDYLDGCKETKVKPELVTLPKPRKIGWNPKKAKAKADERAKKGIASRSGIGSNPWIISTNQTLGTYLARGAHGVPLRKWPAKAVPATATAAPAAAASS